MTTQPSMPRGTRSQSPSAKFYSRTFSTRNTSQNQGQGPGAQDLMTSAPHSKRRKFNPPSDNETATETRSGTHWNAPRARMSQQKSSRHRDAAKQKRGAEGANSSTRASRTTAGNAYTKRASALNLHNYPADHHPVGIAIWVIQKIDSARREGSGSNSSRESSPSAIPPSSSSTRLLHNSGQASENDDGDDPSDRRQAQRERKIKQRLENWAKNKENDVVARAKLDAKKKFGADPSTQPILLGNGQVEKPSPADEKESYIRKRIRDDFTRLMDRQTKVFADTISNLEPFQAGFSQKCFPPADAASGSDANLQAAGTLLVNVLPALAEKEVSRTSQLAADALIQALETGSLSPESFFDAIAILAENREILEGGEKILAQLFSRSSSSGNSKVLRTSSGADSKLFATTNGPFIIYNTIENTETRASPSSRRSNRTPATTNSFSVRASPRERRPTTKMASVCGVSTRPQTRTSMSPRTSPPKALKLSEPSKLRGSLLFTKSRSGPRTRSNPIGNPIPRARAPTYRELASEPKSAKPTPSMNEYQSEQAAPPYIVSADQSSPQIEIKDNLVNNLLDLAMLASREETDNDSDMDDEVASVKDGAADVDATLSARPSPGKRNHQEHTSHLRTCLKPTTHESKYTSSSEPVFGNPSEQMANFNRILEQLPTSEANLSHEQVEKVAALYDQLARGPQFERSKELGLSYPEIPRPFTDRDGWKLTGVINKSGKELVEIDPQSWIYSPEHTEETHQPLRRLKRKAQLEQERIFGFPSVSGYGKEPQQKRQKVKVEGEENVAYEKLMFEVRKAAEAYGLPHDKSLSWEELTDSIKALYDSHGIAFEQVIPSPLGEAVHDEPDDGASSQAEASEFSEIDSEGDSDYEPDPVVIRDVEEVWVGSNGARKSTFAAVNGRRVSQRTLRDRPSSSSSSAQGTQNRVMDLSTVLDPNHAAMSPPSSITKYNIRPPPLSGTFNTFNGPITSSNTPTASPAGTPTYLKLNFNPTSPARRASPSIATRRASTTSLLSTTTTTTSSSQQPLDLDNATAYNLSKGYTASPSSTSSARTASPHATAALNGGFPGGGAIINAPERRGADGRGQRRKSKAPDFKMNVQKAAKEGPRVQARAVRGGTVLKFG